MKVVTTPLPVFSQKEVKIIELTARGYPNKAIAQKVNLSPQTVATYKYRLMKKSGTCNTISLVVYAIQNNLIQIESL